MLDLAVLCALGLWVALFFAVQGGVLRCCGVVGWCGSVKIVG